MHSSSRIISAEDLVGAVPFRMADLDPRQASQSDRESSPWQPTRFDGEPEPDEAALAAQIEQTYAQGVADGMAQARAEFEQEHQQRLHQLDDAGRLLLEGMRAEIAERLNHSALRVVDLAVLLAARLTQLRIDVDPSAVLPIVEQCLELCRPNSGSRLHLHPDDFALVGERLGQRMRADGIDALADPSVGRGACRILSADGEVDARISTRWRELLHQIGYPAASTLEHALDEAGSPDADAPS